METVRLIEQEKVDMLLGFYSSAQCVPVSAKVDSIEKNLCVDNYMYFACSLKRVKSKIRF